jgi:hypothetical protein
MQMEPEQQAALSNLLDRNREGELDNEEVNQLDELMQVYRRGLVRKAQALKVAVERGLRTCSQLKLMARTYIPVEVERRVRAAARNRCGYCLSPQRLVMARLEIEHIIPIAKQVAMMNPICG